MKTAILSMQKVVNYGSFMQSFALRKTIESLGHECEYIDIENGIQMDGLRRGKRLYIKKFIGRFFNIHFLNHYKYHKLMVNRFKKEFFEELGLLTNKYENYDKVVIGSDEVFNFAQPAPWGFTDQLYGNVKCAEEVISYAGSFGHTTINDIDKYGVRDNISKAMNSMSSISVRDDNSFSIVKELTGKEPSMNVDPVFIYDFNKHLVDVDKKDYIIIYTYPSRISDPEEIKAIKKFARDNNKKLISIGFYFPWCDEVLTPHPFEVLSYIKNADFVITDTFHGTIFSIITNNKFVTLVRNTNTEKLTSLLKTMKLSQRIISNISELDEKLKTDIDYTETNKIILSEREKSISYLKSNL